MMMINWPIYGDAAFCNKSVEKPKYHCFDLISLWNDDSVLEVLNCLLA